MTVGVLTYYLTAAQLFNYLRKASRRVAIDEIVSRYATNCLRHSIAVAIVDTRARAAVSTSEMIFVIVSETSAT